MENKGPLSSILSPFSSPLLSSRPRSLLSTAVYMAGLFSLTGCESHETGGHQGPGPPRQHAPPQSAVHSVPQPSPSLPPSLSTLTISFTISNIPSLRLSLFPSCTIFFIFYFSLLLAKVLSQFYQIYCLCLSFSLPNTPSFSLPSSGPSRTVTSACFRCSAVMSHGLFFCFFVVVFFVFLPQPHIIFSQTKKKKKGRGRAENEKRRERKQKSPGAVSFQRGRLRKRAE